MIDGINDMLKKDKQSSTHKNNKLKMIPLELQR